MIKQLFVLYIEDDTEDFEIFEEALCAVDCSILLIRQTCCEDAIEFLKSSEKLPDFIFLDNNMPNVNGLRCLPEIKELCKGTDTTIIMYTSWVDKHFIETAMRFGATQVFKKPCYFDDITALLQSIFFSRQRMQSQLSPQ
jgi:response regulator of citrate/malate metabolism